MIALQRNGEVENKRRVGQINRKRRRDWHAVKLRWRRMKGHGKVNTGPHSLLVIDLFFFSSHCGQPFTYLVIYSVIHAQSGSYSHLTECQWAVLPKWWRFLKVYTTHAWADNHNQTNQKNDFWGLDFLFFAFLGFIAGTDSEWSEPVNTLNTPMHAWYTEVRGKLN